jgi:hypothetical protein
MVTHFKDIGALGCLFVLAVDADSVVMSTRQIMYWPACYVVLMLRASGYSPCKAWEIFNPPLWNGLIRQLFSPLI